MATAILAPDIAINWNPVDNNGTVRLDFREFEIDSEGNFTSFTSFIKRHVFKDSIADLSMRVAKTKGILTGEALLVNMSGAAIMYAIKRLVESIVEEEKITL